MLNTARSSPQRTLIALHSKLAQRFVAPARLLPKNINSVVRPGTSALGDRYLMAGDSARQFAPTRRIVRERTKNSRAAAEERGHSCPMPLGFERTKAVFVPEGYPRIAQRFNVGDGDSGCIRSRRPAHATIPISGLPSEMSTGRLTELWTSV